MAKRKGLPWVKVSVEWEDHPKTKALARLLKQRFAALYLVRVWAHFGRWHEDGFVADTANAVDDIEAAAKWKGPAGKLVGHLVAIGFLERAEGRITVHSWMEWSGTYAERKAADRERKSRKSRLDSSEGQASNPLESTRNSAVASPSPSPSPSPSALEGEVLPTKGGRQPRPTTVAVTRDPFWHDVEWSDEIMRGRSSAERDDFDVAVAEEMTSLTRAHRGPTAPGWAAAESAARQRLESRFRNNHRRAG